MEAGHVEATRRTFLTLCLATAAAAALPSTLRLGALQAYAQVSFVFTAAERRVLGAAANTVVPAATVQTRYGPRAMPGAGDSGAVLFIENLLTGAMIFAAGAQRPDFAMPPGTHAAAFPDTGQLPMWAVKRISWFGDGPRPPFRPAAWPSELARLQKLYRDGIAALNAAVGPAFPTFDAAPQAVREAVLRRLQHAETTSFNGAGELNQPFSLTLL
ncbi:MAG: gluconate 2-dehydrogenase subunit 3 family protein, partial [Candidatus Dormibacteria bacterium]